MEMMMVRRYKIPYRCGVCGVCGMHAIFKDHKCDHHGLLEINYKNGNKFDTSRDNVEFLCPLCFSFARLINVA